MLKSALGMMTNKERKGNYEKDIFVNCGACASGKL
jgi:hypothetical protein